MPAGEPTRIPPSRQLPAGEPTRIPPSRQLPAPRPPAPSRPPSPSSRQLPAGEPTRIPPSRQLPAPPRAPSRPALPSARTSAPSQPALPPAPSRPALPPGQPPRLALPPGRQPLPPSRQLPAPRPAGGGPGGGGPVRPGGGGPGRPGGGGPGRPGGGGPPRRPPGLETRGTRPPPGSRTTTRAQYRKQQQHARAGRSVGRTDRRLPGTYHSGPNAGQPRMGHPTRHRASKTNTQLHQRASTSNIRASTRFASDPVQLRVMNTSRAQAVTQSAGRTNGNYNLSPTRTLQVRQRTGNTPTVGERLVYTREYGFTTGRGYWGGHPSNAPLGRVQGAPTGPLSRATVVLECVGFDSSGRPLYEFVTAFPAP